MLTRSKLTLIAGNQLMNQMSTMYVRHQIM